MSDTTSDGGSPPDTAGYAGRIPVTKRDYVVAVYQRKLLGHGSLVLLWGFVVGFGFLFWLVERGLDGGASGHALLWPIPGKIEVGIPGTYDGWRMAHMEGVVNGFGLWIVAMILPILPFGAAGVRRSAQAMMVVAWTIVVASTLDPLFENSRGLRMGLNVTNTMAFLLFYVGVGAVCVLVVVIAWKSLSTAVPKPVLDD
ncbi:MAG: hypothetical protein AAF547_03235 [Actinomycetota bacterium]